MNNETDMVLQQQSNSVYLYIWLARTIDVVIYNVVMVYNTRLLESYAEEPLLQLYGRPRES